MTERPPYASYAVSIDDDDDNPSPELSTFLGCLKRIRAGEGADGLPWPEADVPPGRGVTLSRVERAAAGLLTVAENAARRRPLPGNGHAGPPSGRRGG